ncbi:hypothetical protein BVG19_g4607 [[Candida] boidinii]|nr:hypothetical protein BVG19_g4607 [[Candida] boidinii]OWB48984.1 hypothetical protein B5S27_g523 [[Candida] boidinii]
MSVEDIDFEKALAKEESELVKDKEIERILSCFKLDAYTILDVQPGITESDIKKLYRKKSLLIHPDKSSNPNASAAFDTLKKAQNDLLDEEIRKNLDLIFSDARRLLMKERNIDLDDPVLKGSEFLKDWREKVKELLIEDEFLKRMEKKKEMKEEEKKREEENILEEEKQKRLKVNQEWESHRDKRVKHWRSFTKKIEKKKAKTNKKPKVLV